MFKYLEYYITFKYHIKNVYEWFDQFTLDNEWHLIKMNKIRRIQKSYMNKLAYIKPNKPFEIALYNKNKWIYLNNGNGETSGETLDIPNLEVYEIKKSPTFLIFEKEFDFHIMMTLLHMREDVSIIEYKKLSLKEGEIIYRKLKIHVYNNLFSYKGDKIEEFKSFCEIMYNYYLKQNQDISLLFNKLDLDDVNTHKSLLYKTWYKASRENQKEWPLISKVKIENGIYFQGMWYYSNDGYVKLSKRTDDNTELYIPKVYKRDKLPDVDDFKLTYLIKNNELKLEVDKKHKHRELKNEKYVRLDYKGNIIETHLNPEVIVYKNTIIGKTNIKFEIPKDTKIQLLDRNQKRIKIYTEEWEDSFGPKIIGIKSLPWYYKQVLHDLHKLNKIDYGEMDDLSDIGIVTKDTRRITWPETIDYTNIGFETIRMTTFKYQENVEINIYD